MNKRIMSLILALLTLTSLLFTGCDVFGQGEETDPQGDIVETASNSAMTLSMYVVSKAPVSEETAKLVEDEFNKITKVNFKTQVKLHFATYEEYYDLIESVVKSNEEYADLEKEAAKVLKEARRAAKAEGVVTDEAWFDKFYEENPQYAPFRETEELTGDDTTAEETELVTIADLGDNSYTLSQVKYPQERQHQIDILWIDSYERYLDFVEKEMLIRLDQELSGSSKKLTEYINGELLTWAKWPTQGTYGIPNNVIIGEYTYLMVNKELAEKYSYNPEELTNLAKCSDFLADVAKYEPGVAPVLGDLYPTNTYYWTVDMTTGKVNSDKFCVLAGTTVNRTHDPKSNANVLVGCNNIFKSTDYTDQLKTIQKYKDAGYIVGDSANSDKYAIRMIKGDAALEAEYGDEYQLNVLEYPRVGYDEVFTNMFAVSAYTRSESRSMQIITYLNTNSDLRNVLQYGVEGVHYKLDEDTGRVVRLNQDYLMNIESTGNVFMAYPEEDMDLDVWEWGKKQNRDAKPYLTLCFDVKDYIAVPEGEDPATYKALDKNQIDRLNELSNEISEKIKNCPSLEELEKLIAEWSVLEDKEACVKNQKISTLPDDEKNLNPGIYSRYQQWAQDTSLYVPVEE